MLARHNDRADSTGLIIKVGWKPWRSKDLIGSGQVFGRIYLSAMLSLEMSRYNDRRITFLSRLLPLALSYNCNSICRRRRACCGRWLERSARRIMQTEMDQIIQHGVKVVHVSVRDYNSVTILIMQTSLIAERNNEIRVIGFITNPFNSNRRSQE